MVGDVIAWFSDAANWSGSSGVPNRVFEHVWLSGLAVAAAALPAIPAGLLIGHYRRFELVTVSVANIGRAIPSFAILALFVPITIRLGLGIGFWAAAIALFFLAIPPMLTNAYVGIKEVSPDTVEAARGMGMSGRQILRRVELPLAAPLVVAGVRTSALQVVATATLASVAGYGGLGRYIIDGFATGDRTRILAGAILVASLAIVTEAALGALERLVRPRTGRAPTRAPQPYGVGATG